jgi:Zn finger protein HypA/HybF involved in hydrogenase expression
MSTVDDMADVTKSRKCLKCNKTFEPEQRFFFLCKKCRDYNAKVKTPLRIRYIPSRGGSSTKGT